MSEQEAETPAKEDAEVSVPEHDDYQFEDKAEAPEFERRDGTYENKHKRAIFSVPVEVVVAVGRANPMIGDLLNMRREAILPLESHIHDPVEIWVGEQLIARGELQEMEDGSGRLSVRLTEIVEMSNLAKSHG